MSQSPHGGAALKEQSEQYNSKDIVAIILFALLYAVLCSLLVEINFFGS